MSSDARVLFVHNFATHYTRRTFQLLAERANARFLFFSRGGESYWLPQHGVASGVSAGRYLRGFTLFGTRVVPELIQRLLTERYDAVVKCINGRFALPVTYLIARLRRKPFILWTGIWIRIDTPVHRVLYPITRFLYRHADAIVVYGSHVKRFLVAEGVRAERVFVAAHAVDNSLYSRSVSCAEVQELRSRLQIPARAKIILYLGRLEPVKGLEYLMEAFASLWRDDAVLVVAGPGSLRGELESLAARLNITDKVRFPGYIPTGDAVIYYSAAYTYVLPSVTTRDSKECWGLVVNEAFNQGLPVITTDAVGAAAGGLVRHGETGLVVPERDADGLAEALQQVLDSPELRDRLSRNARSLIVTWDQEHMVEQFEAAIQFVLAEK